LMKSKVSQERHRGIFLCRLEYENLYNTLQICLANRESVSIFFCLDKYLEITNNPNGELKLAKSICEALENYPSAFLNGELGYQIGIAFELQAYSYWQTNQHKEAKSSYQKSLEILESLNHLEEDKKKRLIAPIYHQLGNISISLRNFMEAKKNYQLSLDVYIEFGDRYSQSSDYHQLGMVAKELKEYAEARQNYHQALVIKIEFDDRYSQAGTYQSLGVVDQELRKYAEARQNYQKALAIFIEFGDRYSQANVYHNLGAVAEDLREYAEARQNYQQALAIKIEFGDRYSQASTYQNLGVLAAAEGNFAEAAQNLLQALEIFAQFQDQHNVEIALSNLSRIYQTTQDASLLESISQVLVTPLKMLDKR
jgi:tetratricopeptide (TPR) repeat protein